MGVNCEDLLEDVAALSRHLMSKNIAAYIQQKQRHGHFDAGHDAFHGTKMPKVGNWNLSLSMSMLGGQFIREKYSDTAKLGKFCESLLNNMSEGSSAERAAQQTWVLLLLRLTELLDAFVDPEWETQSWKLTLEEFCTVVPKYFPPKPVPGYNKASPKVPLILTSLNLRLNFNIVSFSDGSICYLA